MTPKETQLLLILTVLIVSVLVLIFTTGCMAEAKYEVRPMYKSCRQAHAAGVPLPVGIADPGFNPDLDKNNDGVMC